MNIFSKLIKKLGYFFPDKAERERRLYCDPRRYTNQEGWDPRVLIGTLIQDILNQKPLPERLFSSAETMQNFRQAANERLRNENYLIKWESGDLRAGTNQIQIAIIPSTTHRDDHRHMLDTAPNFTETGKFLPIRIDIEQTYFPRSRIGAGGGAGENVDFATGFIKILAVH